jgi:hypothetical protein
VKSTNDYIAATERSAMDGGDDRVPGFPLLPTVPFPPADVNQPSLRRLSRRHH